MVTCHVHYHIMYITTAHIYDRIDDNVQQAVLLWIAVNLQQYSCKYRKPQSITSVVLVAVTTSSELEIELWLLWLRLYC